MDRQQYLRRLALLLAQAGDNDILIGTYPQAEIDAARELLQASGILTDPDKT